LFREFAPGSNHAQQDAMFMFPRRAQAVMLEYAAENRLMNVKICPAEKGHMQCLSNPMQ
jgi:hypothetical protein